MILDNIINTLDKILPKVTEAIFTLLLSYLIIKSLDFMLSRILKLARIRKSMRQISISMATIIMWIIALIFFLKSLGLTGLAVAVSGSVVVIGLAIANGAKELTTDIISGIFLSQDKDFNIGDEIEFNKVKGVIESIDIRKTRLRDKTGILHVIPNSKIEKDGWTIKQKNDKI